MNTSKKIYTYCFNHYYWHCNHFSLCFILKFKISSDLWPHDSIKKKMVTKKVSASHFSKLKIFWKCTQYSLKHTFNSWSDYFTEDNQQTVSPIVFRTPQDQWTTFFTEVQSSNSSLDTFHSVGKIYFSFNLHPVNQYFMVEL